MNIGEANDFNTLLRGINPGANDDTKHRALDAAERLGDRAYKALDAGPTGTLARELVDRNFTVLVWGEDARDVSVVRSVETAEPVGDVL